MCVSECVYTSVRTKEHEDKLHLITPLVSLSMSYLLQTYMDLCIYLSMRRCMSMLYLTLSSMGSCVYVLIYPQMNVHEAVCREHACVCGSSPTCIYAIYG
jgi:hypothetical protein